MIVSTLFGALEVGLPAAGMLVVRGIAAHKAYEKLRREAEPQVERFRQDNTYVKPLPEEHAAAAKKLLETIREARALRASVMEKMREAKMSPATIELMPQLQLELEKLEINFMAIMKQVTNFKIGFLIKDQVEHRMAAAEGLPVKPEHLSQIDHQIIDVLDHFHVIDAARVATETTDHAVSFLLGPEHLTHHLVDAALFPGVISATRTTIQEYNWLMNDETTLTDSLKYGYLPSALRTTLRVIGLSMDISTGWMSGGVFTAGAIALGKLLTNEGLKMELDKYVDMLNGQIGVIRDRQQEALKTINGAQDKFHKSYLGEIEKCPEIGDEPVLKKGVGDLGRAYAAGMAQANRKVSVNTRKAIAKLPKASRLQKLLGVDPAREAARLYNAAERELHSRNLGTVNAFSLAGEKYVEHALEFVLKTGAFDNTETRKACANLAGITERLPADYNDSLSGWQQGCGEMWVTGMKDIKRVTHEEHEEMGKVAKRQETIMKPIRRKIRNLQKRLRHKNLIAA